jgi:hypothetical protein
MRKDEERLVGGHRRHDLIGDGIGHQHLAQRAEIGRLGGVVELLTAEQPV